MALTPQRHSSRDPSKFPTTQLFLLALVRVAEPIALTSILPYAWKLVLEFNYCDKENASFYAGLLIAAFAFAESLSGMLWGALSDKVGRKPVLIMGCLGTVVSLLVVGFSFNFYMALFGRFLGGALNGNIGVIQTMVGELVTSPQHELKAYAVLPFVWTVGTILGPCIGGYFASPAVNFPDIFSEHGIFGTFPYLLPNLICVGLMMISIIAGYFCLQETHPYMQSSRKLTDGEIEGIPQLQADSNARTTPPSDTTPAATITQESYGTFSTVKKDLREEDWHLKRNGNSRTSSLCSDFSEKAFTKQVVMLTIALGIFTYHSMTYDHLLPIFLQDDRTGATENMVTTLSILDSNPLAGGLGLSVQNCGLIMAVNGMIALFVQAVMFPLVAGWLGLWRLFIVVTILHPIAYFIVPGLTLLPDNFVTAGIYSCLTVRNCLSILAYPALLILLKEASPSPNSLGKINGLAASTGAACRTIASPIAGMLYGVGISINLTAIAWWASALVAVLGAAQAMLIKRERKEQTEPRSAGSSLFENESEQQPGQGNKPSIARTNSQSGDSGYGSDHERTPLISQDV